MEYALAYAQHLSRPHYGCCVYHEHSHVFGRFAQAGRRCNAEREKPRNVRRFGLDPLSSSGNDRADLSAFADVDAYIKEELPQEIGFPADAYVRSLSIRGSQLTPDDPSKVDPSKRRQMTLMAQSGLKEEVELTQGNWFSEQPQDGVIEVVIHEEAMFRGDMRVGDVFIIRFPGDSASPR